MIALIWEVWNDKDGDFNKGNDIFVRLFLFLMEAMALVLITPWHFVACFMLSIAINFLTFDYIIAYVLIRNKVVEVPGAHWFSYMGKSGVVDNLKFWRGLNPWVKLLVRVGYFTLAITLIILL